MIVKIPKIDEIPVEEQTPWVLTLLECINALAEENQALRDEIARLKGEKPRPKIKPSSLEKNHKKQATDVRRDSLNQLKRIFPPVNLKKEGLPREPYSTGCPGLNR